MYNNSLSSSIANRKAQHYRTFGLTPQFEKSHDLQLLKMNVNQHMNKFGLALLKYLPNPGDDTKVVNLIDNHQLFDKKKGVTLGNEKSSKNYDGYKRANQRDAITFLTNSITPMLKLKLLQRCHDNDLFITYCFTLFHIVRSTSVERFEEVKRAFKGRNIKNYPGENMGLMSTDLHNGFTVLHEAAMYDQNMSVGMLNSLLDAGSMSTGRDIDDFRHPLRNEKLRLTSKLEDICHKGYYEAHNELVKAELDVPSLLNVAQDHYQTLRDHKRWPATRDSKDSKGLNGGFERNDHQIDRQVEREWSSQSRRSNG